MPALQNKTQAFQVLLCSVQIYSVIYSVIWDIFGDATYALVGIVLEHGLTRIRLLFTRADRQGVDISFTVCVFVWFFVRLRISPLTIMLAESNFAWRFIGVPGKESPILGNVAPQKPKIR